MNSGCEGGLDSDSVQTWTNPLLRQYYIDAKSLFWFLFLEITDLRQSCGESTCDIRWSGTWHKAKPMLKNTKSKENTLHLEVCGILI